ncbi:MAG: hypothetical protein WC648_01180 [Candidatus Paceibacterota bacterium]|jgi:hypothetical protein
MNISFSKEKPEIYAKLKEKFNVNWDDGLIIANGDTIHCAYQVPPEKVVHEITHLKRQQEIGKDLWWSLYIDRPSFRLEEETLAYKAEYKFICENVHDRNDRFQYLYQMAQTLSSPQYGRLCTGDEAMKLIQT